MSAWSFLSKAEGFLDRVLDEQQSKEKAGPKRSKTPQERVTGPSRTSTPTARWQDRLTKAASQFTSTESLPSLALARASFESETRVSVAEPPLAPYRPSEAAIDDVLEEPLTELQKSCIFPPNMPSTIKDIHRESKQARPPLPSSGEESQGTSLAALSHTELLDVVERLSGDLQECELRRVEEAHVSAERISALEARLAYFSNEKVTETWQVVQASGSTADEKLVAEKDKRIALLLSEGDALSKKEMTHLANLKKLRARVADLEGLIGTSLKAVEKADNESTVMKREIKTLQETLRQKDMSLKDLTKLESEISDVKLERQVQAKTIADLKRQLADADDTISQNITIWPQLQAEKARTETLQKRIGDLLLESKVAAEEFAAEQGELQGKYDRLGERSRINVEEKDKEIGRLETELENMRAMLEEATTGAGENSQTKLLRQIESLQTQQSLARQNWARIEESLVLRSSHAEKERDELRDQEDEWRSRLRQSTLQRKEVEEQRSTIESRSKVLENTVRDLQDQIASFEKAISRREHDFDVEKQNWINEKETMLASITINTQVEDHLAEERNFYPIDLPHSPHSTDTGSRPAFSFQRHITDSPNSRTPETAKRPGMNSRLSTQSSRMPTRKRYPSHSVLDELKSPPANNRDENPFNSLETPIHLTAPTEVSLSTVSAGASVGMMERVTANVRKLELEMGILREDLSRLTRQRDEARNDCVEMEAVLEDRKALQRSVEESAAAMEKLQRKFEATLELLGEQTEENDQLREDISDMKAAFRESILEKLS